MRGANSRGLIGGFAVRNIMQKQLGVSPTLPLGIVRGRSRASEDWRDLVQFGFPGYY